MIRSTDNPWLTRYAVLTALVTLGLICLGGVVTSKGVGMSVPDWPTTYGYNMFFFPFSKWVGGIFYEHSHRLLASLVGLMTVILAVWVFLKDSRRWLRWSAVLAVFLVIAQGVLGGMRVEAMKDELGIFHATLAQLFFVLMAAIALFLTRRWQKRPVNLSVYDRPGLRYLFGVATVMILLQLILGATMRHQHAGLAISDFPLAHGQMWPSTDAASVERYNSQRSEETALNPITAAQVVLQMIHRGGAGAILVLVLAAAWMSRRSLGGGHVLTRGCYVWVGLVLVQAGLGAATIWTNKSADVATAHVAVGALILLAGSFLTLGASCPVVEVSGRSKQAPAGAIESQGLGEMPA